MQQAAPIGRADVRASICPARAAYLIADDDHMGFVAAIREASTRWAGVTEPIVPCVEGEALADRWANVIRCSNVDGLVNVSLASDHAEQVGAQIGMPIVNIADIDDKGLTRFTLHPVHTDQYQFVGPADVPLIAAEDSALWQRTALGDYLPDRIEEIVGRLVAAVSDIDATQEQLTAQIEGQTWLDFGRVRLVENRAWGGFSGAPIVLWVTEPDSLEDCLGFWNLRALRAFVLRPAPMLLLSTDRSVDWDLLSQSLEVHLRRPDEVEPDIIIESLSASDELVDAAAEELGLVPSTREPYEGWVIPPPPARQPPFAYRRDLDPFRYRLARRQYGHTANTSIHVYRKDTRIEFDSPIEFKGPGSLMVRLESDLFEGLPRRLSISSMILNNARWNDDQLEIVTDPLQHYRFDVQVPSLEDATWKLLKERCQAAEYSDKGKIGRRLIALGGYEVLLDPNARAAIAALVTPRSKTLLRELQRLREEGRPDEDLVELALTWGGTQQRRFRSVSELRGTVGLSGVASAERLCEQRWAERGFGINCEGCGVRSFVPLAETRPEGTCPACQAAQPYSKHPDSGAPQLQYRLNGLIDRAEDQGVLTHLLAIAVLDEEHEHTYLLPGVILPFEGQPPREADIFGVVDGKVLAGEAKNSPGGFEESDLDNDIALSAALGVDAYLMICNGDIPAPIVERAQQLVQADGLELVLIQGETLTGVDANE